MKEKGIMYDTIKRTPETKISTGYLDKSEKLYAILSSAIESLDQKAIEANNNLIEVYNTDANITATGKRTIHSNVICISR